MLCACSPAVERLAPICGPIIEPIVKHCPWLFRPRVVLVIVLLLMAIGLLVSETIFDGGAAVLYGFIGAVAAFMGVGLGVFHGTVAFCEDSDNTTRCCYFCRVPDCAKLCGANGDEREKCNTLFTDALLVAIVLGGLSSFVITAVQVQLDVNPLYITRDMFVWNALGERQRASGAPNGNRYADASGPPHQRTQPTLPSRVASVATLLNGWIRPPEQFSAASWHATTSRRGTGGSTSYSTHRMAAWTMTGRRCSERALDAVCSLLWPSERDSKMRASPSNEKYRRHSQSKSMPLTINATMPAQYTLWCMVSKIKSQ